jgi:hypothetical protein
VKAAEKGAFFKNKQSYDEKQYTKKFYGKQLFNFVFKIFIFLFLVIVKKPGKKFCRIYFYDTVIEMWLLIGIVMQR